MRDKGQGSVYQRCEARFGCPPPQQIGTFDAEGRPVTARPRHDCKGRWFGAIEGGYTPSGGRRRITVSAKTKKQALAKLRDKKLEVEKQGAANFRRSVTVAKWSEQWLTQIATKVRPSSYEADAAAMRWAVATIGAKRLSDLTPHDVRAMAHKIREDGKSTSTALRYHGSLMRMLTAAAHDGYTIPPNVLLAEKPKAAVNDRDAIPLEHVSAILAATRDDPDRSRWGLALLQGIRPAECRGLTWDLVDLDRPAITVAWQAKSLRLVDKDDPTRGYRIPDGFEARHLIGHLHLVRPKTRAGWRVQPLVPWAANALREWRDKAPENEHGLVWPGRTTRAGTWPRNDAVDRQAFDDIQDRAEIRHSSGRYYDLYECRHTTASLLLELKVPESVRIAIMGHSSIASTKPYEHAADDMMRDALEQVAARLELA